MGEKRIIKKYPNRRLYDTTLGVYITLEEIKQLVFDRIDFKVIDVRNKKDLTKTTLLQIITEQEAKRSPIFTNALLQDLIRFYHEKSQNIFSKYLEQTIGLFIQQKEFFKKQLASSENLFLHPSLMQQMWHLPTFEANQTDKKKKKSFSKLKLKKKQKSKK